MTCQLCNVVLRALIITTLIAPSLAWADRIADEAYQYFSAGKAQYQQKNFQGAELNFRRSLRLVVDHQSLYYKALTISKQAGRCQDELEAWQSYFRFCEQGESNCIQSWIPKARGHARSAQERCQNERPATTSATPNSPVMSGCLYGRAYPGGPCRPAAAAPPQEMKVSPAPTTRQRGSQEAGSLMSHIPVWAYIGLGLGVVSHVVNLTIDDVTLIDATFYGAITGYTVGGVGLGWGLYRSISTPQSSRVSLIGPRLEQRRVYGLSWRAQF